MLLGVPWSAVVIDGDGVRPGVEHTGDHVSEQEERRRREDRNQEVPPSPLDERDVPERVQDDRRAETPQRPRRDPDPLRLLPDSGRDNNRDPGPRQVAERGDEGALEQHPPRGAGAVVVEGEEGERHRLEGGEAARGDDGEGEGLLDRSVLDHDRADDERRDHFGRLLDEADPEVAEVGRVVEEVRLEEAGEDDGEAATYEKCREKHVGWHRSAHSCPVGDPDGEGERPGQGPEQDRRRRRRPVVGRFGAGERDTRERADEQPRLQPAGDVPATGGHVASVGRPVVTGRSLP
jgi:hypothetical protein